MQWPFYFNCGFQVLLFIVMMLCMSICDCDMICYHANIGILTVGYKYHNGTNTNEWLEYYIWYKYWHWLTLEPQWCTNCSCVASMRELGCLLVYICHILVNELSYLC